MISAKSRKIRLKCVEEANYLANHGFEVHYQAIRPINFEYHKAIEQNHSWRSDCSGTVTAIHWKAGNPNDPNRQHYNGTGYTGTLLSNLPHIRRSAARRGDFCVFGGGTGEHVVMLLEWALLHRDPIVFSHGGEYGPLILSLSSEARYHAGQPMTFLKTVPDRW